MKYAALFVTGAVMGALIVFLWFSLSPNRGDAVAAEAAPTPHPVLGTVAAIFRDVEVLDPARGDAAWTRTGSGTSVVNGTSFRTGPDSFAGVRAGTSSRIVMSPLSEARVWSTTDGCGRVASLSVRPEMGSARIESDPDDAATTMLELPALSATQAPGGRLVALENASLGHAVSFFGSPGRVQTDAGNVLVPAGHGVVLGRDGGVGGPHRLARAPRVRSSRLTEDASLRVRLRGKLPARLIVARDAQLLDVVAEIEGPANHLVANDLPEGAAYFSAALIDPNTRLMGELTTPQAVRPVTAVASSALGASPANGPDAAPGVPVALRSGSVFFTENVPPVGVDWAGRAGGRPFTFRIATDAKLENVVRRETVNESAITLRGLKPGRYWWSARRAGEPDRHGTFLLRNVKGFVPRDNLVNRVDERFTRTNIMYQRQAPTIELSWRKDRRAEQYRVVVASASGVVDRQLLGTTPLRIAPGTLADGAYRWTVERLGPDGSVVAPGRARDLILRFDNDVPSLDVTTPVSGAKTSPGIVKVTGVGARNLELSVNGVPLTVDADGRFSGTARVSVKNPRLVFRAIRNGRLSYYVRDLRVSP